MSVKIEPYHSGVPSLIHHVAICPADLDKTLKFYKDGIGLKELVDSNFQSNYKKLFKASSNSIRVIYLGDSSHPYGGLLELVVFDGGAEHAPPPAAPHYGFLMLSFWVDVPVVLGRLRNMGLAGSEESLEVGNGDMMATVRDPDNILIELIPNTLSLSMDS